MFINHSVCIIILCLIVACPSLSNPINGGITCSLGDDGVPSYEDTCSFTCNTGYELTVNDNRTCQSDGSWSGTEAMCTRGTCMYAVTVCGHHNIMYN